VLQAQLSSPHIQNPVHRLAPRNMASLDLLFWLWQNLFLVGVVSTLYFFLGNWLKPGLRSLPGPWLAKFSNIWRYHDVAKGRPDITLYQLHQQHGDYVRLGPSAVSVKNVEVLKTIYAINSGHAKVYLSALLLACPRLTLRTDFVLPGSTTASQWKTHCHSFHISGRELPCFHQETHLVSIFDDHTHRIRAFCRQNHSSSSITAR